MKKLFTLLLICFGVLSATAQKLETNDLDSNGTRYVSTTFESVRSMTDKMALFVGMSYIHTDGAENGTYFLCTRINASEVISIPKGGRMLLKTNNGEILQLSSYVGSNGDLIDAGMGVKVYQINTQFAVTPEQLTQIQSGISKIRIELSNDKYYEKEFKKDKIAKVIEKDYSLINQALQNNPKQSFTEGF